MAFKCIRQTDLASCGPTCIQMICHNYGKDIPLDIINEHVGLTNIGASVKDVYEGLEALHFQSVVVKCRYDKLEKIPLPAILFWRNNHFVVLYKVRKNVFFIADPATGKVRFSKNDFLINWCGGNETGTVVLALPTDSFYNLEFERPTADWRKVFGEVIQGTIRNKKMVCLVFLLILLSSVCNWYIPLLYKKLIDNGVLAGNIHVVILLFLTQLSFFMGNLLFTSLSSIIILKINSSVAISYLGNLLKRIMKLPMKFFDNSLHTEMIQRVEDFNRLQSFISDNLLSEFFSIISLLVFSILLASYDYVAVIIFYIFSILGMIVNVYYLKERKYIDYTKFAQSSLNYNHILEMLQGMREIKLSGAEEFYISKWSKNQDEINKLAVKSSILEFKQSLWFSSINKFRDICVIGYCSFIAIDGGITIGVLISTTYLLGMMAAPMNSMTLFSKKYQDAKISAERISNLMSKKSEIIGGYVHSLAAGIEVRQMSYKYPGNKSKFVLSNLSCFIPVGKVTAIVGRSGCGKTTFMKVLLGFYSPNEGGILVDGVKLSDVDTNRWRLSIGTVFQDGYIFSGTISENIAMSENVDLDKLIRVSKLACIDGFINLLPLKYNTPIGASGQNLSQGQKQRILIARALYKDPDIICFDEATSSLDSTNERSIMENIFSICKGKTLLVIAHRLSTIKNADQIIVIENGTIAEIGTHNDLLKRKGSYFDLVKNQIDLSDRG